MKLLSTMCSRTHHQIFEIRLPSLTWTHRFFITSRKIGAFISLRHLLSNNDIRQQKHQQFVWMKLRQGFYRYFYRLIFRLCAFTCMCKYIGVIIHSYILYVPIMKIAVCMQFVHSIWLPTVPLHTSCRFSCGIVLRFTLLLQGVSNNNYIS